MAKVSYPPERQVDQLRPLRSTQQPSRASPSTRPVPGEEGAAGVFVSRPAVKSYRIVKSVSSRYSAFPLGAVASKAPAADRRRAPRGLFWPPKWLQSNVIARKAI